ncbi:type IX secretion system membrane protein PorP/SprF [Pontibacter locisalis]|uniref:Type IX secretion system membrane protein PorP/SprF n=1 Tax=Pontibacter locisalis TaxID=1719035 RepID=A0ABW5IKW8_9BACT
MKRILAVALVVIATVAQAYAQQRPQYTQYALNNYLVNPAVGGIETYTDLRMSFRSQWLGVEGAPETFYASIQGSIGYQGNGSSGRTAKPNRYGFSSRGGYKKAIPHHGVGAVVQVDKAGLLRASTLNGSYSYHLPLTGYFTLSGGIAAGATQYSVDMQEASPVDPNDPYLTAMKLNSTKLDLGLGLWLYTPDFYVGVSGMQLVKSKDDLQGDSPNLSLQPHLYATAGMRFQPDRDLALIPSIMVKATASAAPAVDFNLRALYNQQVWGGVSYRHNDAWAAMAGVNLNYLLDLSYAYEVATSNLNQVSVGTHEVVLGIKLNNRRKVICPMWVW